MVFNIFAPLKRRRNNIIEKHIQEVVRSGKDFIVYDNIYFESGRAYAIEKGAKAADSTSASAHVLVDGKDYFVVFSKAASGGLVIGTEDAQNVKERLLDPSKMHEHLDKILKRDFDEFKIDMRYAEAEKLIVKDIQDGIARQPSWVDYKTNMDAFLDAILEAAVKSGMSEEFALHWFQQKDVHEAIFTSVAQFEKAGFNESEQISCAYTFIEKLAKAQIKAQLRNQS